jgi:allantoicase
MSNFVELVDLASETLGGAALAASDEFFAPKENLLKAEPPQWIPGKYTDHGKWMDGWETRRRRGPGHDWVIVRLGLPGVIRGVVIDTHHFRATHPESCSIEACALVDTPSLDADAVLAEEVEWREILPRSPLQPHAHNLFEITDDQRATHVRLNIHPDGGVARFRVHGQVVPDWEQLDFRGGLVDLAAIENGGVALAASDDSIGSRHQLLMPGAPRHNGDGWETRRRRGPGNDWVLLQLGARGLIERVEVDTTRFIGDAPAECSIELCTTDRGLPHLTSSDCPWRPLLSRTPLQPNTRHSFEAALHSAGQATHARFQIHPDGGVARLRLWGTTAQSLSMRSGLNRINRLDAAQAEAELLRCCRSHAWAQAMVQARPFADIPTLKRIAAQTWRKLDKFDWLEAFAAHPRLGEGPEGSNPAATWAREEHASVRAAAAPLRRQITEANQSYYDRFGHNFVIHSAGMSAGQVLAVLRLRLGSDAAREIERAAAEQSKITRLRLGKLLLSLSQGGT